jgi:molybdate transport system substrate-binding protein
VARALVPSLDIEPQQQTSFSTRSACDNVPGMKNASLQTGTRRQLLVAYLLLALSSGCWAAELTVAAAADLGPALHEIADNFQKQTGDTVRLSFGSSGNLTTQIENGAPYDLFLSADLGYPERLMKENLAEASLKAYAVGAIVLWVPAESSLDVEHAGMQVLLNPTVKRLAIANPEHAPYGRAAVAALKYYKIYEKISNRLVLGENISQAAQFVESRNAQVGIIALAGALALDGKGRYWRIPQDAYPALQQGAIVTAHAKNKELARKFLEFLSTPESRAIFTRYGFAAPEAK